MTGRIIDDTKGSRVRTWVVRQGHTCGRLPREVYLVCIPAYRWRLSSTEDTALPKERTISKEEFRSKLTHLEREKIASLDQTLSQMNLQESSKITKVTE